MKKTLILASLATVLASAQTFAMDDIGNDIRGTIKVDGVVKIAEGRIFNLGDQGEILNFGRLEGEGKITGKEGSRVVNSIDFQDIEEERLPAARQLNAVVGATNFLEPKPAHIDDDLVETEDGLAVIHDRNIGAHGIGDSGNVFVLVDGLTDDEEYVLAGNDLSVEANLANEIGDGFMGIPHGLTTIGTVTLKGDNSNFKTGPFKIGNWYDATTATFATPKSLPSTDIEVTPKAVLKFSAGGDGSEFVPKGNITIKATEDDKGKLNVPAGQVLVIPRDKTLKFDSFEEAPARNSVPSFDPMARRTYAYEFTTVRGNLASFMGGLLENSFGFKMDEVQCQLIIKKREASKYLFSTINLPSLSGVTLLAKQEPGQFVLFHDGSSCCKLNTLKQIIVAFARSKLTQTGA